MFQTEDIWADSCDEVCKDDVEREYVMTFEALTMIYDQSQSNWSQNGAQS